MAEPQYIKEFRRFQAVAGKAQALSGREAYLQYVGRPEGVRQRSLRPPGDAGGLEE